MRNARLSFSVLVCACIFLAAHRLGGQTVVFSPGAPPPPPPPAGASGAPLRVVPPAPIGIPPEELPRFEVASVKKPEGRVTNHGAQVTGRRAHHAWSTCRCGRSSCRPGAGCATTS